MSYEEEIPEENRMQVEVSTQEEIEEEIFVEEIIAEFDKVYQKIHEGIKIDKKLEYMSEIGLIWSFKRQEKLLIEVVTKGDKEGSNTCNFYYLPNKSMMPSLLINLINKMEMKGQFPWK